MKLLTILYSIYILALALVPCSDQLAELTAVDLSCSHKVGEIHKHFGEHGEGNDEDRDCSPFCVCDCCGVFIEVSPRLNSITEEVISQNSFLTPVYAYVNQYHYSFFEDIWHPPV